MDCQKISNAIDLIKVDSIGRIRNKSKAIDEIHSMHLTKLDSDLMDVRVFVARLSTGHSSKDLLKMIDEFIYNKQIK